MYMTVHHPVPSNTTYHNHRDIELWCWLMSHVCSGASGWNDVNNGHNGLDGIYRGFKARSSSDIIRQWFDIAVQ